MNIYDEVWIMYQNKPTKKVLWAIKYVGQLTQNRDEDGYFYHVDCARPITNYELIDVCDLKERFGCPTSLNDNWVVVKSSDEVFSTKDELIKSLY